MILIKFTLVYIILLNIKTVTERSKQDLLFKAVGAKKGSKVKKKMTKRI